MDDRGTSHAELRRYFGVIPSSHERSRGANDEDIRSGRRAIREARLSFTRDAYCESMGITQLKRDLSAPPSAAFFFFNHIRYFVVLVELSFTPCDGWVLMNKLLKTS